MKYKIYDYDIEYCHKEQKKRKKKSRTIRKHSTYEYMM